MQSYTDSQTMSVLNVSVLSDHIRLYLKINSTQNKYENVFTFIYESENNCKWLSSSVGNVLKEDTYCD